MLFIHINIAFTFSDRMLICLPKKLLQREYEEFKIRINGLVAKAIKVPEEGWIMQDGTPWPGNNTRDHPGMIQVSVFPI
jgi:hypothetical protein